MTDEENPPPAREKAFAALNQDLLGAAAGQPAGRSTPPKLASPKNFLKNFPTEFLERISGRPQATEPPQT